MSVAVRTGSGRTGSRKGAGRIAGVHVIGCGCGTSATSHRQVRSSGGDPFANLRGDRGCRDIRGLLRTHFRVVRTRCQSHGQADTKQIFHSREPCQLIKRGAYLKPVIAQWQLLAAYRHHREVAEPEAAGAVVIRPILPSPSSCTIRIAGAMNLYSGFVSATT